MKVACRRHDGGSAPSLVGLARLSKEVCYKRWVVCGVQRAEMSVRWRALAVHRDELASIVVNDDGKLVFNRIGDSCTGCAGEDFVTVYQRGLLPPPHVQRSHKSLLSNFKISTPRGMVNVPWSNFSWVPHHEKRVMTKGCSHCGSMDCTKCFEELTADNILVVWLHDPDGDRLYQWYMARECDKHGKRCFVLTRVPGKYVGKVLSNSSITRFCMCGKCRHPLADMIGQRTTRGSDLFESMAFEYFTELRNLIYKERDASKSGKEPETRRSTFNSFKDGTCAICLEDTFVSDDACPHKLCRTEICSDCNVRTRGMCPVCDRSKMSADASFLCLTCDEPCNVKDFGHKCIKCDEPCLCTNCYKNCSVCVRCETTIATNARFKRKRAAAQA